MTCDFVALLPPPLREESLITALAATAHAAGGLGVRVVADGAVMQLCDAEDEPLISIEDPYLVHVPGEVERLLGTDVAARVGTPVCWVEIRSVRNDDARRIARTVGDELTRLAGGTVWCADLTGADAPYPWEAAS